MIRKIKSEEIPICVEVIKKSFLTVADEYGLRRKMLLGLQLLQLRKIDCIGIWMESIGQCMYLKKMVFCVDIIHFCYKEKERSDG